MRKITYGAACSLDGYIARADDGVDWLNWSDDVQRLMADYWKEIDTVLMGRRTYDAARASGNGTGAYPGVVNYLFSRTLQHDPEEYVHLVREEAVQFVAELKQLPGGDICVLGGGELAHTLLQAGLIDEVGINLHPVLLGSGIPLFHRMQREFNLELVQVEQLEGGCIYALYRVQN